VLKSQGLCRVCCTHNIFSNELTILGPIVGQLCDNLVKPLRKQNSEASARLLAEQNIQAYQSRHLSTVCSYFKLQTDSVEAIAPCTPLQQGIISRSLISEDALYFEEFGYQLSSTIDLTRLKKAWAYIVASTDVLRLRFCPTVDGHAQVVYKYQSLPWFEKDFDTEEELQAYKCDSFAGWCDTNAELNGPLFEIHVLHTQIRRLLYLRIFHALYDGLSLPMILQAVFLEYTQVPSLKPRPTFMETLAAGPLCEVQGATKFWSQQLLNLKYESELSLINSRSTTTTLASFNISDPKLSEARRRYNTTHQSLVQAAWTLVLRKFFPSEVVFGMVVSGRSIDYENIDQVIGPLFNTIPFYVSISECKSWADIIGGCHDFNTKVIPYQHSPLRDIMRWCQRLPKQPLFETLFVFQKEELSNSATACSLWTQMETTPQADVGSSYTFTELMC
jgi:ferricrocin synthase